MSVFNFTAAIAKLTGGVTGANIADVQGCLNDIKTWLNGGNIDATNIAATYLPAAAEQDYNHVARTATAISTLPSGTFVLSLFGGATSAPGTAVNIAGYTLSLDPADYALTGRTAKMRFKARLDVNAVAPGVTFTAGLFPAVTAFGGSGVSPYVASLLAAVAGSSAVFTTPAANSTTQLTSSDFNVPSLAGGPYVFGLLSSGPQAANSACGLTVELQRRTV